LDVAHIGHTKAVLLDVDGTLYRQAPLRALMAAELLTLPFANPLRATARLRALKAYRTAQEDLRTRAVARPAEEQITAAVAASGLPREDVESLVAEWMIQRPLKYLRFCQVRGVSSFLAWAERSGVKTGVLSDYPAHEKLAALGIRSQMSLVLCASDPDIAAFKPSPKGFLRACAYWNLSPADTVFVGDRPEVDAAGARAAGMRCVIVSRTPAPAGADYAVVSSFEELTRVFDNR
jgi:FMN phosphatase YigB (HAD superfamily)